jgi:hypothetical protein
MAAMPADWSQVVWTQQRCGPVEADVRARPFAHPVDGWVWLFQPYGWRPAHVVAASARAVLVRFLLPGRGTATETVPWVRLAAVARTSREERIDNCPAAADAIDRVDSRGSGPSCPGGLVD